jgi:hypothetical protein
MKPKPINQHLRARLPPITLPYFKQYMQATYTTPWATMPASHQSAQSYSTYASATIARVITHILHRRIIYVLAFVPKLPVLVSMSDDG